MIILITGPVYAQSWQLRGVITDKSTGATLIGAAVMVKGTSQGTVTDLDGRFVLEMDQAPPITITISYIGYTAKEVVVNDRGGELDIALEADRVLLKEAEVIGSRISDKQKQAPLTVESMDIRAIREAPSGDFYESLGALKGVDLVTASFGFKVINTRGFNSTSPVRSLQLIDGVDNQSPGLNFSLGNFLGASDLDLLRVEVIAGASTAYYGPGAFNGVVNMTTKDPWRFPGLSVSVKGGERDMLEGAVRWAQKFKNREGKDKWAYKLNVFALTAEDWYAENYAPTINSPTSINNPGGYDAINTYGDENITVNNNFAATVQSRREHPGLGIFLRPGYREADIVDYGTNNLKVGTSLHYMVMDSVEAIAASNFSTGSTVYQGDNRYRLKNIQFFQHRLELRKADHWFLRGYVTHEDAGDTYDIFTTGIRLQEASGNTREWNIRYFSLWDSWIGTSTAPGLLNEEEPGYYTPSEAIAQGITTAEAYDHYLTEFIQQNNELFAQYHQMVADSVNSLNTAFLDPAFAVGTERFDQKLEEIRSRKFTEGGSLFFDRSALYHAMGEYRHKMPSMDLLSGGSFRLYRPNTQGTIFRDTAGVRISNWEYGVYLGLERTLPEQLLKLTATVRVDKNQNFRHLFSPAVSAVWTPAPDQVVRLSISSAIRNPTLADQYLYYNVGRAILLGNIDGQFEEGRDSLITLDSFDAYRSSGSLQEGFSRLEYFTVDRIRPEQVRTLELGYRGTLAEKFYLDVVGYHSWYTDFIGYLIGISTAFDEALFPRGLTVYRVATNSSNIIRTYGGGLGLNYYRSKTTYGINYSYNELLSGADDPIIPAFNTPRNKFNIGVTGHEMRIPFTKRQHLGFGINYKFVEGFIFEGSPQFTGAIPAYDMVDAQVNVKFPSQNLTVKAGASNLFGFVPFFDPEVPVEERWDRAFNNQVYMVFGGPLIGRLAYVQVIYEFQKR